MGMRAGKERVRTGREVQQIGALALALALSLALASGAAADRACEGPGINHQPEPATSDEVLSVLAYNVYLLPSHVRAIPFMGERFAIAQEERAERIPPFLAPYDVVILSEAYDDDARAMLLDGLKARGFAIPPGSWAAPAALPQAARRARSTNSLLPKATRRAAARATPGSARTAAS